VREIEIRRRTKMRKYQRRVSRRIQKMGCAMLQIDMGLGKTGTVLDAARHLFDQFEIRQLLVVAPLLVAEETWPDEIEVWEHTRLLSYEVITGDVARREARVRIKADIHIINRENLPWLIDFWGDKWPYDAAVIDEISGFKNPRKMTDPTKAAQAEAEAKMAAAAKRGKTIRVAAKRNRTRFGAFCKVRKYMRWVIGMTGTPAPNGLLDLWSQYYMLDQGYRLGSDFKSFTDRWFDSDYMGYKFTPKANAFREIMALIADITISMDSADYIELPPRVNIPIYVTFPDKVMKSYKKFERTFLLEEHDIEAVSEGVLTQKLLQLANGSVYDEEKTPVEIHDLKLEALERVVEENPGQPILVAYSYKFDVAKIKKRFKHAVTLEDDPKAVKNWNAGKIQMLVVHPASAGHGLNLQYGGYIAVWYGLPWSLEWYMQFNKRLHRPNQKAERVLIYHLLAKGTVDERVMAALIEKAAEQDNVIQASLYRYNPETDDEPAVEGEIVDLEALALI
jgi:SNF2 family DNA or RNA helicase